MGFCLLTIGLFLLFLLFLLITFLAIKVVIILTFVIESAARWVSSPLKAL